MADMDDELSMHTGNGINIDAVSDVRKGAVNAHEVAMENELKVLELLHRFGHLRRVDIAIALWPNSSPRTADNMVQRTVSRLLDKKLVLSRRNSYASDSFVLAKNGANLLKMHDMDAVAGYNIQSVNGPQFYHRTLGSVFLLKKLAEGSDLDVFGEYSLMQDWCPVTRNTLAKKFKKMPDGLITKSGESVGVPGVDLVADWVEVESNYKPKEELQKILDIGWKSGEWLDDKSRVLLDKLYIVYNVHIRSHEDAVLRAVRAQMKEKPLDNVDAVLESIILVRADIKLPLKWASHEEVSLLDLKKKLSVK